MPGVQSKTEKRGSADEGKESQEEGRERTSRTMPWRTIEAHAFNDRL